MVIHYTVSGSQAAAEEIDLPGDEGLLITRGTVTDIDRRKKEITITFGNGTTETLHMTTRAAAESEAGLQGEEPTRIIVYYSDESGRKVAHYFKKGS